MNEVYSAERLQLCYSVKDRNLLNKTFMSVTFRIIIFNYACRHRATVQVESGLIILYIIMCL